MKCAICGKEIEGEHYYIDVTPNNHDDYRLYFCWECVDDVLIGSAISKEQLKQRKGNEL